MYINGYDCFVSFIALQCLIERPAIGVYVALITIILNFAMCMKISGI